MKDPFPPFDPPRLFAETRYRVLAEAGLAAVVRGGWGEPFPERDAGLAAFAISTQGLSPLAALLPALPGPLGEFLALQRERSLLRGKRIASVLSEVVTKLGKEGIGAVALKSAVLAFTRYADPGDRPMADLDLLLADPGLMERATAAIRMLGFHVLHDTGRHRVFALDGERVERHAEEHPGNPLRIELHRHYRIDVLGERLDVTRALLAEPSAFTVNGVAVAAPSAEAERALLLAHAAEDFAAKGLRGIQVVDFLRLRPFALPEQLRGPRLLAASAIASLVPEVFDRALPPPPSIPLLRHTRSPHGWTKTALGLCDGRAAQARFLLRTLFPPPGELRANAGAGALPVLYARTLFGRVLSAFGRGRGAG